MSNTEGINVLKNALSYLAKQAIESVLGVSFLQNAHSREEKPFYTDQFYFFALLCDAVPFGS